MSLATTHGLSMNDGVPVTLIPLASQTSMSIPRFFIPVVNIILRCGRLSITTFGRGVRSLIVHSTSKDWSREMSGEGSGLGRIVSLKTVISSLSWSGER